MAEQLDIDFEMCEYVGQLKIEINSRIFPDRKFNANPPVLCMAYFMQAELVLQIVFKHNSQTDMIEAYVDVIVGPVQSLTFKIKYGFNPFQPLQDDSQIFVYTPTQRRSVTVSICPFSDLLDFMVDNEARMRFQHAEFLCTIIISLREVKNAPAKYRIPHVNDCDCDHKIVIGGAEIRVHRRILMASSRFFFRLFNTEPHSRVTNIDRLPPSKRVDRETLLCLLRFMYCHSISYHNLQTTILIGAAREYEMNGLFRVCEHTLINQLSPNLALELFYIGKTEKSSRLVFAAAKYILANKRAVINSPFWQACLDAFPAFFEPIAPNPMRYFRGIVFPEIRSRSADDVWTSTSMLLRLPEVVPTPPVQQAERLLAERDTSSIATISRSASSQNTSRLSCDSLDTDFEPIQRKRSSPVVTRKRPESKDVTRAKSLDEAETLPKSKFSRALLMNRLLASEPKFNQSFGPVQPPELRGSRNLFMRSSSLPDDAQNVPVESNISSPSPMDCRDDTYRSSEPAQSRASPFRVTAVSASPEVPRIPPARTSSLDYPSLEFTYSYSSDSVFERRKSPTVPMSVSENSTTHQTPSPGDSSSIPVEKSADSGSSSSKIRSRREKRMKKTADKTRKFLPNAPLASLPYDFSSSESSTDQPRPTFVREYPTETRQSVIRFQHKQDIEPPSDSSSSSSISKQSPRKVVTFGDVNIIPIARDDENNLKLDVEDIDDADDEIEETRNYMSWLESAGYTGILDTFGEASTSRGQIQNVKTEDTEKSWDEKDMEELAAELRQKLGVSPSGKMKKVRRQSPVRSDDSNAPAELPLGGGVIRKSPGRFQKKTSVDDPEPFSSSESPGTTSSSLASTEPKPVKRKYVSIQKSEEQPTIEASQSFIDLSTMRSSTSAPQQFRNIPTPTLAGVYVIESQPIASENQPTESQQSVPQQQGLTIQLFAEIEGETVQQPESTNDEKTKHETDENTR